MSVSLETRVQQMEHWLREFFRALDREREERERAMAEWEARLEAALERERREREAAYERERQERQRAMAEWEARLEAAYEQERRERERSLAEWAARLEATYERERQERQRAMAEWEARLEADLERRRREHEREIRALRRLWGELAQKHGTLVEDLLAPSTPYVLETVFGCTEDQIEVYFIRSRQKRGSQVMEFDVVAACPEFVLIMEIKSRGRAEYVREFVEKLKRAREFLPMELRDRPIYGAFAAPSLTPEVVRFGERLGLIMLAVGVRLLDIQNSPDFRPRAY